MRLVVGVGRHWPLLSDVGRPRDGPASPGVGLRSSDGRHLRRGPSQPQPTKARHDGASVDRAGARVLAAPPPASATLPIVVDQSSRAETVLTADALDYGLA